MAEATKPTTARPARTRSTAASKPTTTKATTAKAAEKPTETTAEAPAATPAAEPIKLVLEKLPDTKSYAVFTPPAGSGCVGKLYMPLGTNVVKVLGTTE